MDHRLFELNADGLCDEPAGIHQAGDRHTENGRVVDELTAAGTWTKVCDVDDLAMTARTPEGWLSCERCGRTHGEMAGAR